MDLATRIGANPTKLAGTRTNISFLGKGPQQNPLFQNRLAGLENATAENLGKPETLWAAIEDAVGWAKDGKLNSIQTEILGHNLSGIEKVLHPPALPMASVTPIRGGIEGLRRFPRETHKFMGRPLKTKDFDEIDRLMKGEPLTDQRGRTWQFSRRDAIKDLSEGKPPGWKPTEEQIRLYWQGREASAKYPGLTGSRDRLPGPGNLQGVLDQKIGMSRAIARQILQQDTRLKLKPEELYSLRTGKGEPLELMRKYYGNSMANLDAFLDNVVSRPPVNIRDMNIKDIAARALSEVELIPQFAEGGLADILEAPRRGRVVHPGGYAGTGKRQAFIDLARAGGSRQDFIDLAASFKVPIDPFKELTIYDMLMSGALPSELKHGGLARILEV